jgi:hypothetical protein
MRKERVARRALDCRQQLVRVQELEDALVAELHDNFFY